MESLTGVSLRLQTLFSLDTSFERLTAPWSCERSPPRAGGWVFVCHWSPLPLRLSPRDSEAQVEGESRCRTQRMETGQVAENHVPGGMTDGR